MFTIARSTKDVHDIQLISADCFRLSHSFCERKIWEMLMLVMILDEPMVTIARSPKFRL